MSGRNAMDARRAVSFVALCGDAELAAFILPRSLYTVGAALRRLGVLWGVR